jgi:maleylpyruvate isomerase
MDGNARELLMAHRPIGSIAAVDGAYVMVRAVVDGLTDEQARGTSLLPGWSRGHVLTHLARSGDGDRRCADGAAHDEVLAKYPEGMEGRASDIEAGASRPVAALLSDLDESQDALVSTWRALPDEAWHRFGDTPSGRRSMIEIVASRRRELLVHLVDLDLGVGPGDLPADYLVDDRAWIEEFRPEWR